MSTLLNKNYLVSVYEGGRGGSKMPQILSTWFVHSPLEERHFGGGVCSYNDFPLYQIEIYSNYEI